MKTEYGNLRGSELIAIVTRKWMQGVPRIGPGRVESVSGEMRYGSTRKQ